MSTIRRLIAELKSGMLPGAKDIEDLAYAAAQRHARRA